MVAGEPEVSLPRHPIAAWTDAAALHSGCVSADVHARQVRLTCCIGLVLAACIRLRMMQYNSAYSDIAPGAETTDK